MDRKKYSSKFSTKLHLNIKNTHGFYSYTLFFLRNYFQYKLLEMENIIEKFQLWHVNPFLFYVLLYVYILSIAKSIDNEFTKVWFPFFYK